MIRYSAVLALLTVLIAVESGSAQKVARRTFAKRVLNYDAETNRLPATVTPAEVRPGETVTVRVVLNVADGFYTYPLTQTDAKAATYVTRWRAPAAGDVIFVGPVTASGTQAVKQDETFGEYAILKGAVAFEQKAVISPRAAPGKQTLRLAEFTTQVCDTSCVPTPPDLIVEGAFTIKAEPAVTVEPAFQAAVQQILSGPPASPPAANDPPSEVGSTSDHRKGLEEVLAQLTSGTGQTAIPERTGLTDFLLTAIFFGGVTLLTPCVFPMIPITVSFFLHQKKSGRSPLLLASVYSLTIVVVLSVAALLLLKTFSELSINPWMNIAIGALFIVFALSLFGMYELTLPAALTRFTSDQEGRGGLIGTVFMALTFTIVSFSCVAPFLGGFGGMVASGQFGWFELILGALAFAGTFAAPFFILALFPSLLHALPKSGAWLNTVKVVMGFVELAAALKFFRTAEIGLTTTPSLFSYDLVLGMYVALSLLCGLYLLQFFRLPHDEARETVGVPRFLVGAALIGAGLYLLPALFPAGESGKHRPKGTLYAWIDAFLLPDSDIRPTDGLTWTGDLKKAVEEARQERRRTGQPVYVFIDCTAKTCQNCKLNEKNVFPKPEIRALLQRYKRVALYTPPTVPDELYPPDVQQILSRDPGRTSRDAAANLWFMEEAFQSVQLPLYVILEPQLDGTIARVGKPYPEGKINDEQAFAQFLRSPYEASTSVRAGP